MGEYVANQLIKTMIKQDIKVNGAQILMLGITFKENCPDVRNTKVVDVISALESYSTEVSVYDPWANPVEVMHEYGIDLTASLDVLKNQKFDAIVLTVSHQEFLNMNLSDFLTEKGVIYDVKGILPLSNIDKRL